MDDAGEHHHVAAAFGYPHDARIHRRPLPLPEGDNGRAAAADSRFAEVSVSPLPPAPCLAPRGRRCPRHPDLGAASRSGGVDGEPGEEIFPPRGHRDRGGADPLRMFGGRILGVGASDHRPLLCEHLPVGGAGRQANAGEKIIDAVEAELLVALPILGMVEGADRAIVRIGDRGADAGVAIVGAAGGRGDHLGDRFGGGKGASLHEPGRDAGDEEERQRLAGEERDPLVGEADKPVLPRRNDHLLRTGPFDRDPDSLRHPRCGGGFRLRRQGRGDDRHQEEHQDDRSAAH